MSGQNVTVFKYNYNLPAQPLKVFLRSRYHPTSSTTEIEEVIANRIVINGKNVGNDFSLSPGDQVHYTHRREDESTCLTNIVTLFEDEWILAISKPDGFPVTPSGRFYFNSLAISLREWSQNDEISPLHRLDIETSGVLLFCKKKKFRGKFQKLFERKQVTKDYIALVTGTPNVSLIQGDMVPLAGSKIFSKQTLIPSRNPNSQTLIKGLIPREGFNEVWLSPVSGKTNQLRVHMASIGCPIVGDKKYHPNEEIYLDWFKYRDIKRIINDLLLPRQALHCHNVSFTHPVTEKTVHIQDATDTWSKLLALLNIKLPAR
ncbi:MAG: RluA family pseudouridine synthase [Proteobacteria bacterium]|nr:RluA family pseudouridine synthase [Pseudomonadota bacterium]